MFPRFKNRFLLPVSAIWIILFIPRGGSIDSPYERTETILQYPEPELRLDMPTPERYQALLGNTQAGQSEFPWIVDIKVPALRELDAVGNLLTTIHVLTACRTIINYEKYRPVNRSEETPALYEGVQSMRITYASIDLTEVERSPVLYGTPDPDKKIAGARLVSWVLLHPACDKGRNFASDFALLGMNRPIPLLPPYITLAPIWSYDNKIPDLNNWVSLMTQSICYVGSWGRNYSNIHHPMTFGHKVKIRVYAHPDFSPCLSIWSLLCREDSLSDKDICHLNTPSRINTGIICMYTRARVGGICDKNKGSPVVCDGSIYGMVTRGVPEFRCISIAPMPFMVVNMHRITTGDPVLYSGAVLTRNRGGSPIADEDKIIIHTRSGCPEVANFIVGLVCSLQVLISVLS